MPESCPPKPEQMTAVAKLLAGMSDELLRFSIRAKMTRDMALAYAKRMRMMREAAEEVRDRRVLVNRVTGQVPKKGSTRTASPKARYKRRRR